MSTRRQFIGAAGSIAGAAWLGVARGDVRATERPEKSDWLGQISQPRFGTQSRLVLVPMRDGVRLAVRLVMPDGAEPTDRFPALLTYSPYRFTEDDGIGWAGYYAERGYVVAYVDVRGTGTSEGETTPNQYSEQEHIDGLDIIEWLGEQPWSNGNVGMFGSSYGGFNATQMAMRQPPALKTIVAMHATDDVYTDDVIYYDGALQFESLGRWPFFMIALNGMPAWPDYDANTDEARFRIENEPWIFEMLRHQRNDGFWQRQSLRPDYSAIEVPTMMVGGWLDAYTDSIPRMLENLDVPRRAIVGQWTHGLGRPGPAFDIRPEMLRWWDHWLKDNDTGVLNEPELAMFANESYKPDLEIESIPGGWRATDWPPAGIESLTLYPQPGGRLTRRRQQDLVARLDYRATTGMTNRYRCPHNAAELPIDQRADDAYSLTFDTELLESETELLGFAEVVLHVSASAPLANWIVRLCDVAPDGTSTLVSKGILNGAHRDSHVQPETLIPDRVYELRFKLKAMSWQFPQGHRIRVAIANADFPNLWPTPYPMTTKLFVDASHVSKITLPIVESSKADFHPYVPPPTDIESSAGGPGPKDQWEIIEDKMARTVTVFRETRLPFGMVERRWCTASNDNPAVASIRAEGNYSVTAEDGRAIDCSSWMTIDSDQGSFSISARRLLKVDGDIVHDKTWSDRIPRDLV